MDNIHTLVAYKLCFDYMHRNNPLKDELSEKIKADEKPDASVEELLNLMIEESNKDTFATANGNAFKLSTIESKDIIPGGVRYHLVPQAGKSGRPFTVLKKGMTSPYRFSKDSASIYENHMFLYDFGQNKYLICHRYGGSGCKTVFMRIANRVLKDKGIKVDFEILLLPNNERNQYQAQAMILRYYKPNKPGDIADQLSSSRSRELFVREIKINLLSGEYNPISGLISQRLANKMSKEQALIGIKQSLNDNSLNDAKVVVKFGHVRRTVDWNSLENLYDGFDITDDIRKCPGDFLGTLKACSDQYLEKIRGFEQ